jgi:cyclopropane fatty-acyl-phospholipid synthase-like methyltransferase
MGEPNPTGSADGMGRVVVTAKGLARTLPGARRFSLLRQRLAFTDSAAYWERAYTNGETSGQGSYGTLGTAKAEFLNAFVVEHGVESIIEFGCGDGHQLSLSRYPRYIGLDVSRSAIAHCKQRFAADLTKSFFLYDGTCFVDRAGIFVADMALSLDVVYHLVEDTVFEAYMNHLFAAGQRYVVAYATNTEISGTAPHVRHRRFTSWVEDMCPHWRLVEVKRGPGTEPARADYFIYCQTVKPTTS